MPGCSLTSRPLPDETGFSKRSHATFRGVATDPEQSSEFVVTDRQGSIPLLAVVTEGRPCVHTGWAAAVPDLIDQWNPTRPTSGTLLPRWRAWACDSSRLRGRQ
jgi:hypothetical protein